MPRKPLAIGTYGSINVKEVGPKKFRASARYRDQDGITRPIQAFGVSAAKAERALKDALVDRTAPSGGDIDREMRLTQLADLWLDELAVENRVSRQTLETYRDDVGPSSNAATVTVKAGLGNLRIHETTTSRVDRFLKSVAVEHPAKARRLKVILSGMLGMAVRHDAIQANPVRETANIRGTKSDPRALTLDELAALRSRVKLWQSGAQMPEDDHARQKGGRARNQDLMDFVDIMLASGARIGEVLAIRWTDCDLGQQPARLTVNGTVIRIPKQGLTRQSFPKGKKPRIVLLPQFATDTLMRLKMNALPNEWDVIFPSSRGTLRDPHNLRRMWREARGSEFAWVTPHSFRRTVATLVDREHGSKAAAAQLGHSGTAITEKHYIEKASEAPDLTHILDQLGSLGSRPTP